MTKSDNLLDRIVLEFPENKKEITLLYNKSIDFIEVCEDYIDCMNSIHELKKMEKLTNEKMMNDLEAVSIELREELLAMI
ncbi:MAG: hypothetical protein V2I62_03285 [Bacteroidales bacterium]|jgi:hypothetical protein|nr:hypothetical protein [Bacteroidales bacterium]